MFLKDYWYAAAWSHEVGGALLPRTIVGESIVLLRDRDGAPVALQDRCPHRYLPLSQGQAIEGGIRCAYHGISFDTRGACTGVPSQTVIPDKLRVRTFPAVEKHGLVWLWMGDAAQAASTPVPDHFHVNTDPAWTSARDYILSDANYQLIADNLIDLTHAEFVHGPTLATHDGTISVPVTKVTDDAVLVARFLPASRLSPVLRAAFDAYDRDRFPELVDQWWDMYWWAPSLLLFNFGATPPGRPRSEGLDFWALDVLTPATETSTHYFWSVARQYERDNDAVTRMWHLGVAAAFLEDKAVLEAQQAALGDTDLLDLDPVCLRSDAGGIAARRIIRRLLEREAGASRRRAAAQE